MKLYPLPRYRPVAPLPYRARACSAGLSLACGPPGARTRNPPLKRRMLLPVELATRAPTRVRTWDPPLRTRLLCPLSYGGCASPVLPSRSSPYIAPP